VFGNRGEWGKVVVKGRTGLQVKGGVCPLGGKIKKLLSFLEGEAKVDKKGGKKDARGQQNEREKGVSYSSI